MKKINLLFTAILLLCCVGTVKAEEVTIDGIKYDVVTKAKQATVIRGETKYSGSIVIPSEITHNNVTHSVTSIGSSAFRGCSGLTSVTIPNSVTSIGSSAFSGCSRLTSVTIPNSVTSIGNYAFEVCSGLTSVVIGNSVTSIGNYAFYSCSRLTSITIPNSVTSIGVWAFGNCWGLTSVTIPNSVTSIGSSAFYGCSGLTSITIPNSVTSIGNSAFSDCSGLTSIEIPNSVTRIESSAFNYCSGLTSVTIPNSVTRIESSAFNNCSSLTSVTIPNSVTSIGGSAFSDCDGLTSIEIPNSVTSIGSSAFSDCDGLTSVTIGTGVKNIGSEAFAKCSNLTDVYCLATSVQSTNATAFNESNPEYMTLHVPAEAINSYQTTAPWSNFGTIVTLDGESVVTPKCENPVIKYSNGELVIECETENAEFVTEVTNDYTGNYNSNAIALSATYNISVYATASGYENSDIVNATLCWIECDCDANVSTGIIDIPAKAVLVTSNNGTINITCSLEGESVELYTSDAMFIESTTIENGCATIESGLSKGDIAIVKIGEKSIKIIID